MPKVCILGKRYATHVTANTGSITIRPFRQLPIQPQQAMPTIMHTAIGNSGAYMFPNFLCKRRLSISAAKVLTFPDYSKYFSLKGNKFAYLLIYS
jgi:hypothetical protein